MPVRHESYYYCLSLIIVVHFLIQGAGGMFWLNTCENSIQVEDTIQENKKMLDDIEHLSMKSHRRWRQHHFVKRHSQFS
jgi:hypothetical protein